MIHLGELCISDSKVMSSLKVVPFFSGKPSMTI